MGELKIDNSQEFENSSGIVFSEGIEINNVAHAIGLVLRDRLLEMKNKSHAA